MEDLKEISADNHVPTPTEDPFVPLRSSEVQPLARAEFGRNTVYAGSTSGGSATNIKRSSDSINLPSIAAGGTHTGTVTLTGVDMGDFCIISCARDLTGLVATAYVSSANTVTYVFYNPTAGAIDLDVMSIKVLVFPVGFNSWSAGSLDKTLVFEDGVLTSLT